MEHYKRFTNHQCEFFPCHKGVEASHYNCLFCYCPLYMLGEECGGNFKRTSGVKDCSDCTLPHDEDSYERIMEKMGMVIERGSRK